MNDVTACVKVKNEQEFITLCLSSIINRVDKIVVVLNNCTDRTEELIDEFIIKTGTNKIKKVYYTINVASDGATYQEQLKNGLGSNADYYNWCYAQCDTTWVIKWDADMLALPMMDNLKETLQAFPDIDCFCIDGLDLMSIPTLNSEPRVFKRGIQHFDNTYWEELDIKGKKLMVVKDPAYLHLRQGKQCNVGKSFINHKLEEFKWVK